tara:strand:+ start:438 stop:617 length:180 start_codon:yes stop_codon:yes gene_type:complete
MAHFSVNFNKITQLLIASMLVVAGVVSKNSTEQLGSPNHPIWSTLGLQHVTKNLIKVDN